MDHSDQALWTRIADGDPDALGELFNRHSDAVYNLCFRLTGDWSVAEDLTSVVFLEVLRRRRSFDLEHTSARPWLLGIAVNVVHNQRRSVNRHARALRRLGLGDDDPGFADDAVDRLAATARARELIPALRALPRKERDVLSLCVLADLSYEEAAAALNIPIGTVRSRLSRGRARLRDVVAMTGPTPDDPTAAPGDS